MNWLLIVIIIMMAAFGFNGYRLGLIKKIFTMFSFVITIIAASAMAPYVTEFLVENTAVYDSLCESLGNVISIEDNVDGAIEESGLPKILSAVMKTEQGEGVIAGIEDSICARLAQTMIEGISFVAAFLLITIILRTLMFTLDIIAKLPLIKGVNQYGGLLIGLLECLIIVWIFFMVVTIFASTAFGKEIMVCVNDSVFLKVIYDNNVFFKLIKVKI